MFPPACARRPDFVIDATFDLFCELCATDEQCDFPVVYASGVNGIAGGSPADLADDLAPLFEAIVREVRTRLFRLYPLPIRTRHALCRLAYLSRSCSHYGIWVPGLPVVGPRAYADHAC
jgi:hypothetical protein